MKRILVGLLTLALILSAGTCAIADSQEVKEADGVVAISAITKNFNVYHRVAALVIDYGQNVEAPGIEAFTLTDTAMATYSAAEEVRDSQDAVVTAVYTNNVPEMRLDKTSVTGQYVIIELQGDFPVVYNEEAGRYVVENTACMATWRHKGEARQRIRKDYSELTITQNEDVKNETGEVVATAGKLPTLQYEDMQNLVLDNFQIVQFKSPRGYDYYYALYLPEDYDEAKEYPLIISLAGNGSWLDYTQLDEEGNLICLGANISADQVATYWPEYVTKDVIVIAPQTYDGTPAEWGVDNALDVIYIVDNIKSNYAVDKNHVVAISSSRGGMLCSQILTVRPDLFTHYLACNTMFTSLPTMTDTDMPSESFVKTAPEDVIATVKEHLLVKSTWIDEARRLLQPSADSGLKIYVLHAAGDETIPSTNAVLYYEALCEVYEDAGYTSEEIEEMLRLQLVSDEDMLANGICKFHSCSKYAVLDEEVVNWVLGE